MVDSKAVRQYHTDYAAHILGRIGSIPDREAQAALNEPYNTAKEAGEDLSGSTPLARAASTFAWKSMSMVSATVPPGCGSMVSQPGGERRVHAGLHLQAHDRRRRSGERDH